MLVGAELEGVHFHVQYLGSQLVEFPYLLAALHHLLVLLFQVDILYYTQYRTDGQDSESDQFQEQDVSVAGLFL